MNFNWCLVSRVFAEWVCCKMQCSGCSFSRAGKCTSTAKAFLLLNIGKRILFSLILYFKTENPNLGKENTRKTTPERQCLNWSINFKHTMFVKNKHVESPQKQVADTYPGAGLKIRSAFQSLLTKTFATFLYAISLFTSHGTEVQLLEKHEW